MARRARSTTRASGDGADAPVTQLNNLLAKLPDDEVAALLEDAEVRKASLREVFFEIGDPIESVYFPITGMASLVTVLKDGTYLECMTVGREGFVGLPLFHGLKSHRSKGICQIEGEFYKVPARAFSSYLADGDGELSALLHRYSQFAHEVVSQFAACNSTHLVEQRCARWLLMTADAIGATTFKLTQEFLSQMLAVRRPGVTVAVGALERQGLIAHRYGEVSILDVTGLRKVSCECYETISEKARELLSYVAVGSESAVRSWSAVRS
jgi:CRP-like cAMP-binding protein